MRSNAIALSNSTLFRHNTAGLTHRFVSVSNALSIQQRLVHRTEGRIPAHHQDDKPFIEVQKQHYRQSKPSPTMSLLAPGPDNLFAKMVRGEIPCNKVAENEHWLAFLDIQPLSKGHTLVIPKCNVQRAHEVPVEFMATFGPFLTKVIKAVVPAGMPYNLLQNNGNEAHQAVMYTHFHIIPKPDANSGLQMEWNATKPSSEELAELAAGFRKAFEEGQ